VENGDNIDITLTSNAGNVHSAGELGGEKIFGGVVSKVEIDTSVLPENVEYGVSCIDYTKEFDRKEVNDSWEDKNARQIIVAFVTEDLNNINNTIDLFEYANNTAIQAEWIESGDGDNPTTDTSDFVNGNGTASGVFPWSYSGASATFVASPSSVDISDKVGVTSGTPVSGKFGIWMKIDDYTVLDDSIDLVNQAVVRFRIGSDASNYISLDLKIEDIATNGDWCFYVLDFVSDSLPVAGTPDWTNVSFFGFSVYESGNSSLKFDDARVYEDEFFTFKNVQAGSSRDSFKAPFQRPTTTIDALAKLNSYFWKIDYDRDIHFKSMEAEAAPWELTDGSRLLFDMHEAGWTLSQNDQWYLTANSSRKVVSSATPTVNTGLFDYSIRNDGTTSPTGDKIQVHVYIENEIPTDIKVTFATNTGVDEFTYAWTSGLRLGYQSLSIDKTSFSETGNPSWASIKQVDFEYTHTNNNPTVTIDSIWMLRVASSFYYGDKIKINIDSSQLKNSQTVTGGTEDSASTYSQVFEGDGAMREWLLKAKFKNLTVAIDNNSSTDTMEVGTTTTNVTATAHGLLTNDYIVNRTRSNAVRKITKVDDDNFTVEAVASQTSGDTFSKFATSKTVGVENLVDETTVDYVSNFQEKSIRATDSEATLTSAEFILFTYTEKIDIVTQYKDGTSITRMKALLGYGDGQKDGMRIDDPNLDTRTAARDRARSEVDQYKNALVTLNFTTDFDGLKAGQLLFFQDSNKASSESLLIQKVAKVYNQDYMKAKVTCATTLFGIIEYFQKLSKTIGDAFTVSDAIIELVESEFPVITISESHSLGAAIQATDSESLTISANDSTEKDKTTKYQPESASDVIDGLDATTGWSVTDGSLASITLISNYSVDGVASLSFSATGSGRIGKAFTSFDISNSYLNIWFRIKDSTVLNKIDKFKIFVSSSDLATDYKYGTFWLSSSGIGNWRQFKIDFNTIETVDVGVTNLASIVRIELDVRLKSGETLSVGDIMFDYIYLTDAAKSQTVYGIGAYS